MKTLGISLVRWLCLIEEVLGFWGLLAVETEKKVVGCI
jgi:hypothetical protein